jgi:hypothetical protein
VIATGDRKWIHEFHLVPSLAEKVRLLFNGCPSADAGSSAIAQMLVSDRPDRAAAFAMAVYPAAAEGLIPSIGAEGVADLGRIAQQVLSVDGEITWKEPIKENDTTHPEVERSSTTLKNLSGARRERAAQLFNHLIVSKTAPVKFGEIEAELEACVRTVAEQVRR